MRQQIFWHILAVTAVAFAGLFSILLVLLRTPILAEFIPYKDFFKASLIVHVDLSVLVWFFAFEMGLISKYIKNQIINLSCAVLMIIGMALLIISPFSLSEPLLNNYIPVLQNFPFALGLAIFTTSVLVYNSYYLLSSFRNVACANDCYYTLTSVVITLYAFVVFVMAHHQLSAANYIESHSVHDYFERLFWGGGHILQFLYLQLLQYAWLKLVSYISNNKVSSGLLKISSLVNLLIIAPTIFIAPAANEPEYISFFTEHMRYFAGIGPTLVAIVTIYQLLTVGIMKENKIVTNSLYSSILLFFMGGIISLFISESNTIIPAHYHGSVVGITLALQGVIYLKYIKIKQNWQNFIPVLYALGQLMHIFGLAISGGYGALRKTPGEVLSLKANIALAFMGLGGLIALIGGLLFVIICYNAFANRNYKV